MDPRIGSETKIVPPHPLPHVSRRALARVKDALEPPCACRYCGGEVVLVSNKVIYGREYGDWPYAYLCRACRSYVGLHPSTDLPLGTLANESLRKIRNSSKAVFHRLIEKLSISRSEAYSRLATKMGKPISECHFGMFEEEDCVKAEAICARELKRLGA